MLLQSLSPSGIQRIFQCLKVPKFQAPFGDNFSALKASCFGTFTQLSEPPNIHWNSSMIFCQFSETFLPGNFRFLFYVGTQALQASKDLQDLKAPKFCAQIQALSIVQKLFCQPLCFKNNVRVPNLAIVNVSLQALAISDFNSNLNPFGPIQSVLSDSNPSVSIDLIRFNLFGPIQSESIHSVRFNPIFWIRQFSWFKFFGFRATLLTRWPFRSMQVKFEPLWFSNRPQEAQNWFWAISKFLGNFRSNPNFKILVFLNHFASCHVRSQLSLVINAIRKSVFIFICIWKAIWIFWATSKVPKFQNFAFSEKFLISNLFCCVWTIRNQFQTFFDYLVNTVDYLVNFNFKPFLLCLDNKEKYFA